MTIPKLEQQKGLVPTAGIVIFEDRRNTLAHILRQIKVAIEDLRQDPQMLPIQFAILQNLASEEVLEEMCSRSVEDGNFIAIVGHSNDDEGLSNDKKALIATKIRESAARNGRVIRIFALTTVGEVDSADVTIQFTNTFALAKAIKNHILGLLADSNQSIEPPDSLPL